MTLSDPLEEIFVGSNLAWLHPFWALGLPIALSLPIGWWMCRYLDVPADRAGRGLDALPMFLCRLLGRREPAADGLEAVRRRLAGVQRRPVRAHASACSTPSNISL